MKKITAILLTAVMSVSLLAGCADNNTKTSANPSASTASFNTSKRVSVVSRETGSGTRTAFIELFGIEVKDANGNKTDMTTEEADIASKTDVMMSTVANDPYAIGYVSLGSLNDTIKTLDVDGNKATAENVKNGTYKISRPFNIAVKGEATGLTKDFIDYILSKDGQEVIANNGCIAVKDNTAAYSGDKPSGKIVIDGSTSVFPVMEKLVEAYKKINANADIELQSSDSSAGMTSAVEGACNIGMASRDLKDSEKEKLTEITIAKDGLAVIVNKNNTLTNITGEQVKSIFTGETTKWSEVQ